MNSILNWDYLLRFDKNESTSMLYSLLYIIDCDTSVSKMINSKPTQPYSELSWQQKRIDLTQKKRQNQSHFNSSLDA